MTASPDLFPKAAASLRWSWRLVGAGVLAAFAYRWERPPVVAAPPVPLHTSRREIPASLPPLEAAVPRPLAARSVNPPTVEQRLAALARSAPGEERFVLMCAQARSWAERNPAAAYQWVRNRTGDDHLAAQLRAVVIGAWARLDRDAAVRALLADDELPGANAPLAAFATQVAEQAPRLAEAFAELIDDEPLRLQVYREIGEHSSRQIEAPP